MDFAVGRGGGAGRGEAFDFVDEDADELGGVRVASFLDGGEDLEDVFGAFAEEFGEEGGSIDLDELGLFIETVESD